MKAGDRVYAEVAPSFVGQYRPSRETEGLAKALSLLGFRVSRKSPTVRTSPSSTRAGSSVDCSETAGGGRRGISSALPAVPSMGDGGETQPSWIGGEHLRLLHIRWWKQRRRSREADPGAKVVLWVPCVSRRRSASGPEVRDLVDFVLTYEELAALFMAKGVDPSAILRFTELDDAYYGGKTLSGRR
jgi:hypothetical protein